MLGVIPAKVPQFWEKPGHPGMMIAGTGKRKFPDLIATAGTRNISSRVGNIRMNCFWRTERGMTICYDRISKIFLSLCIRCSGGKRD